MTASNRSWYQVSGWGAFGDTMLHGFLLVSLISGCMIALTCLITYEVMRGVWHLLPRLTIAPRLRILFVIVPAFVIHIINIWLYAVAYFVLEIYANFGVLKGHLPVIALNYETFIEALYFSSATYTSLGLGDVIPTHDMRMLAGAEVLNGLLMIGWTVSFTYLAMERFWKLPHSRGKGE